MTDSTVFVFVLMLFLVIVIADLRSVDDSRSQRAMTSRWPAAEPLPVRDAGDAAVGLGQPWNLWMVPGSAEPLDRPPDRDPAEVVDGLLEDIYVYLSRNGFDPDRD
ncbi:MAG TPA: hypothetical protein VII33_09480 [Nakamurella sp.]|jgi:hypothetical protein